MCRSSRRTYIFLFLFLAWNFDLYLDGLSVTIETKFPSNMCVKLDVGKRNSSGKYSIESRYPTRKEIDLPIERERKRERAKEEKEINRHKN